MLDARSLESYGRSSMPYSSPVECTQSGVRGGELVIPDQGLWRSRTRTKRLPAVTLLLKFYQQHKRAMCKANRDG